MNQEYLKLYQEGKFDGTFYQFVILVLINEQDWTTLQQIYNESDMNFIQTIAQLEQLSYCKWHGQKVQDISLRLKGENLFGKLKRVNKSDVYTWIDAWRELFPAGNNNTGYKYRGDRLSVLKKMTKFVAQYPYTREEIFEATKRYVNRFSTRGYLYMQQAHYFIEKKDVGSSLASECESLKETKNLKITTETNYGGKVI